MTGPATTGAAADSLAKKKRGKKQVVKVDFDAEHNFAELSKRGKVGQLAHACLRVWARVLVFARVCLCPDFNAFIRADKNYFIFGKPLAAKRLRIITEEYFIWGFSSHLTPPPYHPHKLAHLWLAVLPTGIKHPVQGGAAEAVCLQHHASRGLPLQLRRLRSILHQEENDGKGIIAAPCHGKCLYVIWYLDA